MSHDHERVARMIRDIEQEVAYTREMIGRHAFSPRVMAAMRQVPRHAFVPPDMDPYAYDNGPLPIGHGQTISQPYIVALMTDLLEPKETDIVLEVGTGSGYQAAILSRLVKKVYSLEIVAELSKQAGERLHKLGFTNVETRAGDGYFGWQEHAPYDAIIVTAANPIVPPSLIEQLKPGGRLVIPVGEPFYGQDLQLIEKDHKGKVHTRSILPVAFVPLTGMHRRGDEESGD